MRNKTKIFLGTLLLLFGTLVLFNNAGFLAPYEISFNIFWNLFWPILFLGVGITLIFDKNLTVGSIFSLIGLTMLISTVLSWDFWSMFWPLILIVLGISMLVKRDKKISINDAAKISDEDTVDDTVIFWGVEKKVTSKNFKGGEVNTIFGGYQLDLREAKVNKKGAMLNVNCAFGGVEILVPKDCRVITNGTGIIGGWVPNIPTTKVEKPVLTIQGVVAFGGVEIKG